MVALAIRAPGDNAFRDRLLSLLVPVAFPAERAFLRDFFGPGPMGDVQFASPL